MLMGMTNEQSAKFEILIRLDELNQVKERTTDESLLKWIQAEIRALRARLATL